MAANINNQDLESYANFFGINTICKAKWASQWPHLIQQELTSENSSPTNDENNISLNDDETALQNQQNMLSIDQQAFQQAQQLSLEQLQLISQLQVRKTKDNGYFQVKKLTIYFLYFSTSNNHCL